MNPRIQHFGTLPNKIVCVTAYTAPMARLLAPHADLLLVGDSVGMVLYGMDDTRGVTLDMMCAHTKAVRRGAPDSLIIADMPYGTYAQDKNTALKNAHILLDIGGADAVKLEGGQALAPIIHHLVSRNIPVMGHIGLLPQSAPDEGGYKIKGETPEQIAMLVQDMQSVQSAGAFAAVLEGVRQDAAATIVAAAAIPIIGIGASAACHGQVLVSEDMLGLNAGAHLPKFVKQYAALSEQISAAAASYAAEVRSGHFPSKDHIYS